MQLARWGELGEEGLGERTKERSDSIWFKHSISLHYHHKNINTWKLPSYRTLSDRLDNYVSDRDVMHKKLWPCSSATCTCWLGGPKWVQSHPPPSMGPPSARTQGTSGIHLLWSQWCFQVLPASPMIYSPALVQAKKRNKKISKTPWLKEFVFCFVLMKMPGHHPT